MLNNFEGCQRRRVRPACAMRASFASASRGGVLTLPVGAEHLVNQRNTVLAGSYILAEKKASG